MNIDYNKLKGVHPDLVKVVKRAAEITDIPFKITEGMRTIERQKEMVRIGTSKTMNSRHLTGHAVDIVPYVDVNKDGKVSTQEMYSWPLYYKLAKIMKQAAKDVGVTVEWGGDWKSFKDGPHWQLPFSKYPKNGKVHPLVDNAPEYTIETESSAKKKAIGITTVGTATAATTVAEVLPKVVDVVKEQQNELNSGDYIRMAIAAIIVIGVIWIAWRKMKSDG